MLISVNIQGSGVAACCCARLLLNRGLPVTFTSVLRPNLPSVLVSSATQQLLADVFADSKLFDGFPIIRKRIVLWRNQSGPTLLPHSGVVAAESILLERLLNRTDLPGLSVDNKLNGDEWRVLSTNPMPHANIKNFGSRTATATSVDLSPGAEPDACLMEALEEGWLFLLPHSQERGNLLSVGAPPQVLLGKSRLVAAAVGSLHPSTAGFPAYPRILYPLCGAGWLACGTGALGFDPICGEGAGNAVREAILVAAVLGYLADHPNDSEVLTHYSARLLGGFLKHLKLCSDFYQPGSAGEWWEAESSYLESGIDWATGELLSLLGPSVTPRFRLAGFDLQSIG